MIRVLEDNAGRFHLTNGLVMWTAATHPTDEGLARAAAGEWRRGEWAPNEVDGWVPTPFEAGRLREVDAGPGFICKTCGGPSPMGVGYTSTEPGAREASMPLVACGCGASRRPDSAPVGFFLVDPSGRLLVWTDNERHAASLRSDYGEGYRVRPAMVQAVADRLLARYVAGGGNLLEGRRLLVEYVHIADGIGTIAEGLEACGFARHGDEATRLAAALVDPNGERVEVHDDGQALEVRLPSWLTDDERRAIVEQLNAFFVAAVEAVRR